MNTTENIPTFEDWFHGSVVVDEAGVPAVAYHGTLAGDFENFSAGDFFGSGYFGKGVNFTSSAEDASKYAASDAFTNLDLPGKASVMAAKLSIDYREAKEYITAAGGQVIPAFLSMKNPLYVGRDKLIVSQAVFRLAAAEADVPGDVASLFAKFNLCTSGKEQFELCAARKATKIFRQIASIQMRDGLIIDASCAPMGKGATHYLLFDDAQIRSAVLNKSEVKKLYPEQEKPASRKMRPG